MTVSTSSGGGKVRDLSLKRKNRGIQTILKTGRDIGNFTVKDDVKRVTSGRIIVKCLVTFGTLLERGSKTPCTTTLKEKRHYNREFTV